MTWDPTWEKVYRERDWGRYPPEELIRFMARHYYDVPDHGQVRVAEIGCGTGANIWYLAREGFEVYGLDGSKTAIEKTRFRLNADPETLRAMLFARDASALWNVCGRESVDAVIDVCCLQHNRIADIHAILQGVYAVLKPGGRVFSMMVATGSWGEGSGTQVEPGTYTDIPKGPAAGLGITRFVTLPEVCLLFSAFQDLSVETSSRTMDGLRQNWRMWVIEGRKPE